MTREEDLIKLYVREEYPLAAKYDMHWVKKNEMGPNVLQVTEALTQKMDLKPGMRVLDIGCGTALSSIFLAKEFDVQVWATDLWIEATENWKRIEEVGLEDSVYPIHSMAQNLPFADEFFDAIVSLDSFHYFGTDVHSLEFHILKHLKRGGQIGIVSPASPKELPLPLPEHLGDDWYWLNSRDWWYHHWNRCPDIDVEYCEMLSDGWDLWVQWQSFLEEYGDRNRLDEIEEFEKIKADKGEYLGFVRIVGRRKK